MGNFAQAIEKRFANSVKNRVKLSCTITRTRGGAKDTISAALLLDGYTLFQLYNTDMLQDEVNRGDLTLEVFEQNWKSNQQLLHALRSYPDLSIDQVLSSNNPIIRAFGMIDARLGKRRLSKLDVKHEPSFVQSLFRLRCESEGLLLRRHSIVTALLQPKHQRGKKVRPRIEIQREQLSKHKRSQDVRKMLSDIEKDIFPNARRGLIEESLCKYLAPNKTRSIYIRSLQSLSKSKLLQDSHITGVMELIRDHKSWVRPLETWIPRTYNPDRQFRSLARHLFAEYDVPPFMDQAWLSKDRLLQRWFKHIGNGQNIRKAPELPVPLTKMMGHHFLCAPDHYNAYNALRWGQARSLGADLHMADAIAQTQMSDSFMDNDFWQSVIAFFARNPMMDPVHVGPIVDYIWNQKYENVIAFVERGIATNLGPAQPNFSMKGRTVESLISQVERWHNRLGKQKAGVDLKWARSSIANFEFIEGTAEKRNMRIWRIFELLTSNELNEEGRQMRHCVGSYAQSCYQGRCSIWAMTLQNQGGSSKMLTIEVRLNPKSIRQVRGKMNRMPDAKEREVIQRWATREGLAYS